MPSPAKATKKEVVTAFRTREILAAARRVLLKRQALEAITMEEIAAAAGVAKGTLYLYFRGKEDLIQAIMTQTAQNFMTDLEAAVGTAGSPSRRLEKAVALISAFLDQERFFFPVFVRDMLHGLRRLKVDRWRQIRALDERFMGLLTRLFAEGVNAGEFIEADPRLLAFLFRGLLRGRGYYLISEGQRRTAQETLPVLLKMLFSGVLRRPAAPAEVTS